MASPGKAVTVQAGRATMGYIMPEVAACACSAWGQASNDDGRQTACSAFGQHAVLLSQIQQAIDSEVDAEAMSVGSNQASRFPCHVG